MSRHRRQRNRRWRRTLGRVTFEQVMAIGFYCDRNRGRFPSWATPLQRLVTAMVHSWRIP